MKKKLCIIGFLKMGIGHYIAHIYNELQNDYDIIVVSYTHGAPGDLLKIDDDIIKKHVKKYQLIINPHGFNQTFESIEKLFQFFDEENFHILNLHISAYTRLTSYIFIPIIEYFKEKGLKIIYTIHDVIPYPEGKSISDYLRFFYNLADAAIVGNKNEEELLKKEFKFNKPIFITSHGIYHLFDRKKFTRSQALSKLSLSENQEKILFFGILRENKGIDDLIEAFNLIVNKNLLKNPKLIICLGIRGNKNFDIYQKIINQYHLENKIELIVKDHSTIDEIEILFKACDVIVLPYTQIAQSGILNLALAFHKPSIITNLFAEAKEIDKKMGFVVPPKNPNKLALTIQEFFLNKEKLSILFEAEIRKYNQRHSFKHTAQVYKKIIESLI